MRFFSRTIFTTICTYISLVRFKQRGIKFPYRGPSPPERCLWGQCAVSSSCHGHVCRWAHAQTSGWGIWGNNMTKGYDICLTWAIQSKNQFQSPVLTSLIRSWQDVLHALTLQPLQSSAAAVLWLHTDSRWSSTQCRIYAFHLTVHKVLLSRAATINRLIVNY